MEPISEVLGTLVAGLIEMEASAGRGDRAQQLETAAIDASLPGHEQSGSMLVGPVPAWPWSA